MARKFDTIDGFTAIETNISLYRPSQNATPPPGSPALIVLCSWMGAAPRHIAKYTAGYQTLYAGVPILLIQSSLKDTFSSDAKLRPRFLRACDTILSYKSGSTQSTGPIVLHTMSNGGGIASTRLATIFKERGSGPIFNKFICDCMPSIPNVEKGVQAVAIGLPKNVIIRSIAKMIWRIWMHVAMFIHCVILRQEDILTKLRRMMNDRELYDPKAPRLYVYSKKDALVPWQDVRDHAQMAKEKGWKDVEEVVFEKAPHCGLVMEDAGRYWKAVKDIIQR